MENMRGTSLHRRRYHIIINPDGGGGGENRARDVKTGPCPQWYAAEVKKVKRRRGHLRI